MESTGSYGDILLAIDPNIPLTVCLPSSNNLPTFPTEGGNAQANTCCLNNVSTLKNVSCVSKPQTGHKRRLTNQQTEETSGRKYKKFQHLPEDIAEFRRQKVNKMERDRQGSLSQDIRNLKPLILKDLDVPGHSPDSKYYILKSSVYTIQQLSQEISTLTDMLGSDDEVTSSDGEQLQPRVQGQELTNTFSLSRNVKPSQNMNEFDATKCMPIRALPMFVAGHEILNTDVKRVSVNPQSSGFLRNFMEPTKNSTETQVTIRKNFSKVAMNTVPNNLPLNKSVSRPTPTNVPLPTSYSQPFNGVFNAPINGANQVSFDGSVNNACNVPINISYNASFNGFSNAPFNRASNGSYNPPINGANSASIIGASNGAYNPPINGANNVPFNVSSGSEIQESFDGLTPIINVVSNAPINGTYTKSMNELYYGPLNGFSNTPMNGVYDGSMNIMYDTHSNAPIQSAFIEASPENAYFISSSCGQPQSDHSLSSPASICPNEQNSNIAMPTSSVENETLSTNLFHDDSYVPNFLDLIQ